MKIISSDQITLLFQNLLGIEGVTIPTEQFGTYFTAQTTNLTITPKNIKHIIGSLAIARSNKIHIHPVSTGKNWGYGCSTPASNDTIVMNLSQLSKISNYNDQLGIVTIEPGVTQRQLADYLKINNDKYWMDCSGSSSDCSVVGNTLDRGFGYSPYSNHAKHIVGMEIILPNGDMIKTGHGRFNNAHSASTYRAGTGPSIDNLFIQSNLGIVTKLTIELMRKPDYFEAFFFKINQEKDFPILINTLGELRKSGCIQSAVHIGNAQRVIPAFIQYPWEESNNKTPLPEHLINKYRKMYDIGAWNGSGAIYGTKKEVAVLKKQIKSALNGKVDRLQFLSTKKMSILNYLNEKLPCKNKRHLNKILKILNPMIGIMSGKPADSVLSATYWRKKSPPPEKNMNPERDKCGLIWCSPVAPLTGEHAVKICEITHSILPKFGYEPAMTITLIDELNIENIISITYDRENEDDQNALNCYFELEHTLAEAGYYPYRLGIHAMESTLGRSDDNYNKLLKQIKGVIDPDNIIAPGRYII